MSQFPTKRKIVPWYLDSIAVPVFGWIWLNLTNTVSEWVRDEVPYLIPPSHLHFLIILIPVMPPRHFQLHFLEQAVHWLKPMCYGWYPCMRWQTKRKNWDRQGRLRERPERRSDGSGRCISSVPKFGTAPATEKRLRIICLAIHTVGSLV